VAAYGRLVQPSRELNLQFCATKPLLMVLVQHSLTNVFRLLGHELGIADTVLQDCHEKFLLVLAIERRLANEHLVEQNPVGPPIDRFAVRLVEQDFRTYVICDGGGVFLGGFLGVRLRPIAGFGCFNWALRVAPFPRRPSQVAPLLPAEGSRHFQAEGGVARTSCSSSQCRGSQAGELIYSRRPTNDPPPPPPPPSKTATTPSVRPRLAAALWRQSFAHELGSRLWSGQFQELAPGARWAASRSNVLTGNQAVIGPKLGQLWAIMAPRELTQ